MGYLQSILGQNERVIFATRRHWLVIAASIIGSVILAIVVLVAAFLLSTAAGPAGFLLLLLLIFPVGRLVGTYLNWWNEQYIVTNRRIIQLEGVFNKHVIDSSLEKVNDVVMSQSFLGRLLGYGDIEIMTASDIGVNKLEVISDPIRFKTTMLDQKEGLGDLDSFEARAQAVAHQGPVVGDTIPELIEELATLRDKGLITEEEFQAKKADLMSRL